MSPIKITLNKIKAHSPCESGWKKLLAAQGKTKADDVPFPMSNILDSNGLDDCLWAIRCLPEHNNLWRKYAVWCARQVEHLMKDERSLNALDVAWRHSEGMATDEELSAARDAARDAARYAAWAAAWDAAWDAARYAAWAAAWDAASAAARAAAWDAARYAARYAAWENQSKKLREILDSGDFLGGVQ